MKVSERLIIYVLMSLSVVYLGCEEDDPVIGNPDAQFINDYFSALPDWNNKTGTAEPDRLLQSDLKTTDGTGVPYNCEVYEKNLVRSLENIVTVETNFGTAWPGALVQGNSIEGGDLELINVGRAPITINTDLAINNTSRSITNPNSVTVQQAISEIQIESGQMPDGSQAGAGLVSFQVEEASSFEQSMLSMGLSAGFTEPQSQVGLSASADVKAERAYNEHTVVAKFLQELFTVRVADDLLPTPTDFFGTDVTMDDILQLENSGAIGDDNTPLYIESVTYGRIMLFTMKSTEFSTIDELTGTLNLSMMDYVEGGGSLTEEERTKLGRSTTTMFSAGGTKEGANEAIGSLNWSAFFKPAPATTAVPISFVAKTLDGKRVVKLLNNVLYQQRESCQAPSSYEITVTLNKVKLTNGICLSCSYSSLIKEDGKLLSTPMAYGKVLAVWEIGVGGSYGTIKTGASALESIEVISGFCTAGNSPPLCGIQQYAGKKSTKFSIPFSTLISGNNPIRHVISGSFGRTIQFNYNVRKVIKYQ